MMNKLKQYAPMVLSLVRIVAALLFMEHGLMKLFHFPAPQPGVSGALPPMLMAAAALEIVGGGLLALGLFSRPVAFVLSGQMAVAYFIAHYPKSPWPGINGGDPAILYCFIFFYLVFAGPGPLSLDAMVRRKG
jgi:putative oxidoreductase